MNFSQWLDNYGQRYYQASRSDLPFDLWAVLEAPAIFDRTRKTPRGRDTDATGGAASGTAESVTIRVPIYVFACFVVVSAFPVIAGPLTADFADFRQCRRVLKIGKPLDKVNICVLLLCRTVGSEKQEHG